MVDPHALCAAPQVNLFGQGAKKVPFVYAKKSSTNHLPAFVGRPEALMCVRAGGGAWSRHPHLCPWAQLGCCTKLDRSIFTLSRADGFFAPTLG